MKKKIMIGILAATAVLFLSVNHSFSAQGIWRSAWSYDLNGFSSVGTTNAYTEPGWFQLRVIRGSGDHVGNYSVQLAPHQKSSATFFGAIGDKQGIVLCSPQYYHLPWFNS